MSRKSKDSRQSYCKACTKQRYNETATRHKAMVAKRRSSLTKAHHNAMREYLSSHPCVDCGESDIIVLEFDHLSDKTASVCALMRRGCSWRRIEEEIAKCEVVCSNCHKRRTYTRCSSWRIMGV